MPVVSTHSFVNHKGGVGKTTLTYQLSASYAAAYPDCKVLILDTTEIGDVSELLMGGVYGKTPRDTLKSLVPIANVTKLFLHCLSVAVHKTLRVSKADITSDTDQSVVEDVIEHMPRKTVEAAAEMKEHEDSPSTLIRIEEYSIPLSYVNSQLPSNVYLCPSGLDIEHPIAFSETQSHCIMDVLLESFRRSESEWKIFVDTDAAAGGHADVYTLIALGISDFMCLPLHSDMTDWYHVRSTLNDLHQLRTEKKSHAQVQLVLWNGLSVQYRREHRMGTSMISTFTPTKAEQDILTCLNNLVLQEAQHFPGMFLHYKGAKISSEKFGKDCCLCIRNFGAVGVASKDTGVPIEMLRAGLVHGMNTSFNLSKSTISHCRENLGDVVRAIEASTKLVAVHNMHI